MSGIYITGMEMPTSCWDCEVGGAKQMDNATCPFYSMEFWEQENYQDKIADGCPLIPVPPHGKLGDLDALKEILKPVKSIRDHEPEWTWGELYESNCRAIDSLPIIIPADPVKEEEG